MTGALTLGSAGTTVLAGAGTPVLAAPALKLPDIDYAAIAPMLVLLGAGCVAVLVEALVPREWRYRVQVPLTLGGLVAALAVVVAVAGRRSTTAGGAIAVDGPALLLQGALAVLGILAVLLIAEQSLERGGTFVPQASVTAGTPADRQQAGQPGATEVYPLTLFALGGMMLFVAANDLLTLFVALEVFSLPLYLLCGLSRRRRLLSQEAAVKYFLLGAFSSAFFLYGVALLYGYAGTMHFGELRRAVAEGERNTTLLVLGLAMLAVGLLFKAAAVPFHVWTPDVYQGAPTPITALMAACTKVAAFGGLLRVFNVAFPLDAVDWRPVLVAIAIATMLIGAVLAVTQTDIKRLLAYSSIANAGYLLTGVLALTPAPDSDDPLEITGVSGTMFYLVAYGFAVLAAFGIVTLVRDADGEATHLSRWAGLGRRSPLFAALFTFLMLTFVGIPLTSGFMSKYAVFSAAWASGQVVLVIVGLLSSVIIAFPYLRIVVLMYLSEPAEDTPTVSVPGMFTATSLTIGLLATAVLGLYPTGLLDLAARAGDFVS